MQCIKLSNLAAFNMGQSPSSLFISEDEIGIPFLQGNAEFGSTHPKARLYCQKPLKIANKGDILISVRAPVGALNKTDQVYCIGRGLAAIRFTQVLPNFGWHLLNYWARDLTKTAQGSTFEAISKTDLENLLVFCPSNYEEQRRIATILDTIDTQIQETERLVAKLKQVKVGLLHDLLTCGIDENGDVRDPVVHPEQFKDSVVGRIPKGWEVKTLSQILIGIDAGKSPNCPDTPAAANEWGVLKVSAIHPGGFKSNENKVIINPIYINSAYEVHDGDLLISRANTYELVGTVCFVRKPRPHLLLCDKTLRLHIHLQHALTEFIFYILQMPFVRAQIEINATGSSGSMKNISQDTIKHLIIYVPSQISEQQQIIKMLNSHDTRIATEEEHLAKLKQVKKGLMDDLLSGRVRTTELFGVVEKIES